MLAKLGIDTVTVEKVLNHTLGGVAAVYNRYNYDNEKKAALLKLERHLDQIIVGPKPDKVVALSS
jgi:hypothetical protein